jgi:hypothetical protein
MTKEERQQELIDDSLMLYVLISTRGVDWEKRYDDLLTKRTKELLENGWTLVEGSKTSFWPPKKI